MARHTAATPLTRIPLLLRGEAAVAPVGLVLAAITIATLGAAAWWGTLAERAALREARADRLALAGTLLADDLGDLFATGEVSRARMRMLGAARELDLEQARVLTPDGSIVAAESAAAIVSERLPDAWGGAAIDATTTMDETGRATHQRSVEVAGRGSLTLLLQTAPAEPAPLVGSLQAGIGVILTAGLAAVLVVYRVTRRRLTALGQIRDGVRARAAGEGDAEALRILPESDEDTAAWNRLVEELLARDDLRAERRLSDAGPPDGGERRLAPMCDAVSQGLILVGSDGSIRYCNGAAAFMLGRDRASVAAAKAGDLFTDPRVAAVVADAVGGASAGAPPIDVARSEDPEDGILRVTVRSVQDETGRAAVVMIQDVTQQHVAARSREAFVASVAHELRTPLTNILMWAESAAEAGTDDTRTAGKALTVIVDESRRLERVVQDMLSISEIEAGRQSLKLDDVDLRQLFEQLEHDHAATAKDKGVELVFDLPPKLPTIRADRDKLLVAVHNLVGNAVKYTPVGGSVTARVLIHDDGSIVAEVEDTGIGIAPDDLEVIFERFQRAKDERISKITGSGLGLAIARDFARLHGGDIEASSELDQGTTFRLSLPGRMAA